MTVLNNKAKILHYANNNNKIRVKILIMEVKAS